MDTSVSTWVTALISAGSALTGVLVGGWLSVLREREDRRHRFVRQQIETFYAPMVGLRNEIKAKSEVRVKVRSAAREGLAKRRAEQVSLADQFAAENGFKAVIDYDNKQLVDELLPAYRRMLDLFRENSWLAEESTKSHYQTFFEFVEIWNRWIKDSIPSEALDIFHQDESSLYPFYDDLEENLKRLRNLLRTAKLPGECT